MPICAVETNPRSPNGSRSAAANQIGYNEEDENCRNDEQAITRFWRRQHRAACCNFDNTKNDDAEQNCGHDTSQSDQSPARRSTPRTISAPQPAHTFAVSAIWFWQCGQTIAFTDEPYAWSGLSYQTILFSSPLRPESEQQRRFCYPSKNEIAGEWREAISQKNPARRAKAGASFGR